ncbi:MAG: OB-fold nucleic acid binding domain-containing protein [Candidatus Aenigmatarchaeota archaeon]
MRVNELFEELMRKSGLSKEELKEKIENKIKELNNLITIEGAIYIIAREIGIELPSERKRVKISSILPGIKRLNFCGRVFRISKIVEFDTRGKKGRVVNLFIGDNSGYVRLSLWNDQVEYVDKGKIKVGSVVQIINGYSKEGMFGEVEVSLGSNGLIKVLNDVDDLPSAEELEQKFSSYERISIRNIRKGNVEIVGFVVRVFKANYIVEFNEDKFLFIPTLMDDGTGILRVIFFRDVAEYILGRSLKEFEKISEERRKRMIEENILGKEFLVRGVVRKNELTEKLELIASYVNALNYTDESYKLMEEFENE